MKETKARILIVEDESVVALDIKMRLIRLGYEVSRIVSTGADAISAAEELKPNLVLMDISLKGPMLGTEAAQKIHDMLDIPIVFLTAYASEKTLGRAKLAEPFAYIIKPIAPIDLRVTIEIALYKAKAEKERKELTLRLQKALDEIRTLSGLIPICASCKKVRDDPAYWQAVEQYMEQHPRAQSTPYQDSIALFAWEQYIEQQSGEQFTHGICPDCIKKLS